MGDLSIPNHTVIQYVRNKKRIPYGVIVAVKDEDQGYRIGFSLCNKKDHFNKKMALKIAIGRAFLKGSAYSSCYDSAPRDVSRMFYIFNNRCKKYYKIEV